MSNCYSLAAANVALKCTEEQYKKLHGLLYAPVDHNDPSDFPYHGYDVSYNDGQVFFYAEENQNWEGLSENFLKYLGEIIAQNNFSTLAIGVCYYSDKMYPGSVGGSCYTIDTDGHIDLDPDTA